MLSNRTVNLMKKKLFLLFMFFIAQNVFAQNKKLTEYDDPFIGTGGHGHTYPGATLPFGMIQLSPDTGIDGWDWCSGYHYSDNSIMGSVTTYKVTSTQNCQVETDTTPASTIPKIHARMIPIIIFILVSNLIRHSQVCHTSHMPNGWKCHHVQSNSVSELIFKNNATQHINIPV